MVGRATTRRRKNGLFSSSEPHWSQTPGGYKRELRARKLAAAKQKREEAAQAKRDKAAEKKRIAQARKQYAAMMKAQKKRGGHAFKVAPRDRDIADSYAAFDQFGLERANPMKRKRKTKNPAAEAIEGYEAFHGRQPDEFVTVSRQVHFHKHLSGAGKLKKLVVLPVAGKRRVVLSGFGGALLAFNEQRSQLFIEGGDQSVDVTVFGIDERPHELETLGQVKAIEYFTTKDHLGDEGGTATYVHRFRTTNENGQHVTIRIARYPDLIYRTLDKQLEFSGGSYTILPEGIDR
jgi:hypothetical protein